MSLTLRYNETGGFPTTNPAFSHEIFTLLDFLKVELRNGERALSDVIRELLSV